MAEGDSIARLAARLHAASAGALMVGSDLRHPRCSGLDLTGRRIVEWAPRGKHLLMRFDGGWTMHSHLRMSGRWTVLGAGRRLPPSVALRLTARLRLADGRTLAGIALPVLAVVRTRDEHHVVGHLGPDLLGAEPDLAAAARAVTAAPGTAVAALLDQRRVAGLGNMWAQELLFLHGIDPWRPAADLDAEGEVAALLAHGRDLLRASLDHPGQVTTGRRGPGAPRHFVYGRKGRPCLRCATSVAFRAGERTAHGRETWWCPRCQPR